MAQTGNYHIGAVRSYFGAYGVECVEKLIAHNLAVIDHANKVCPTETKVVYTEQLFVKVTTLLLKKFNTENSTHNTTPCFGSVFLEGLSEKGYTEWVKIDQEAFKKKIALSKLKQNQGPIRAFTFSITDKLKLWESPL